MKKYEILSNLDLKFNNYSLMSNYFLSSLNIDDNDLSLVLHAEIKPFPETVFLSVVKILYEAAKSKVKVMICGDYDCDGICSATIMKMLLNKMKILSGYYLPHRFNDGYGTSKEIIIAAYKKGYRIVVMIDNGVSNFEAIELAKSLQMKVIIIDHHQISQILNVDCLIHPDILDNHFNSMCASGLVYTLALSMGLADEYMLVLAMIGTIGDVMPVLGQNRAIISEGLIAINKYHFTTIEQLTKQTIKNWRKDDIAFKIVPCFNCLSRLCDLIDVNSMIKYLLYDKNIDLYSYSKRIIDLNNQRKQMSNNQYQLALNYIDDSQIFIAYHQEFHPGIIGIIAGKVASEFNRLSFVLAKKDNEWVGSCRSVDQIDIYEVLIQTSDYLRHYGGHKLACGFSVLDENLLEWKKQLLLVSNNIKHEQISSKVLQLDLDCYYVEQYLDLLKFEPFGNGFELLPVYVKVFINKIIYFRNGGARCLIEPINQLSEILVFNSALLKQLKENIFIEVIGNLGLTNNNKELLLIVSDVL